MIQGATDFLKTLKLNGHKIGIVTNCNRNVATNILKITMLEKYVDYLVIGNECNNSKPHPDPYIKGIKYFDIPNTKTTIFEDSKTGLQSAKSTFPKCLVGIETVYNNKQLLQMEVDYSIKNYLNLDFNCCLNNCNLNFILLEKFIKNSMKHENIKNIKFDDVKLKGGFISDVLSLEIETENTNLNCVLKLENKSENFLSTMANNLNLYSREYYFYNNIQQYVPIKTPKYYGTIKDDNFDNLGILLENLNVLDYNLNLDLNKEKIDVSLKVIESLAKMHSCFWDKKISEKLTELKNNNNFLNFNMNEFVCKKYPIFIAKWKNVLTEKQQKIAEHMSINFKNSIDKLNEGKLTLCHGDVKSANIFYKQISDSYEPYFIDWQYISEGKGVQDLVFFMIESFEISVMKKYTNIFKDFYYIKLLENGINEYLPETYNVDFVNAINFFPFFVAIWFGTLNEDELIDKNFPYFFIQKLFNFAENYILI